VGLDIATIYVQQWIQETFYDPQNRQAFTRDLERERPRIEPMIARYREGAQRIRALGGVPYAIMTLHVVYRSYEVPLEDALGHSSFEDLWVESVTLESARVKNSAAFYMGRDPAEGLVDPGGLGPRLAF
jgi:hypothetical protein